MVLKGIKVREAVHNVLQPVVTFSCKQIPYLTTLVEQKLLASMHNSWDKFKFQILYTATVRTNDTLDFPFSVFNGN